MLNFPPRLADPQTDRPRPPGAKAEGCMRARERTCVRAAHVRASGARAARGVHDHTAPACLNFNSRSER
eukprot:6782318-Prymnesium_polylepis.1